MHTRRDSSQAQPEIEFLGEETVVPTSHAPTDPAVTAAFIAFHRKTGAIAASSQRSGYVSGGGLALAVLAILGFGGGLFLALFSFNSPEGSPGTAAGRPREMIYSAPANPEALPKSPDAPSYAASGEAGFLLPAPFEIRPHGLVPDDISSWPDFDRGAVDSFATSIASAGGPMFAGMSSALPASGSANDLAGGGFSSAFGALTGAPAPVPEPSTWATMLTGAGLLVFATRLKRRLR